MATSTAAKPYVVQDSVVAPQAETRSGWVTFAGVVLLVGAVGNLFWGLAALDSKLRACDLVALRVDDVALNGRVRSRATVMQRKTGRSVQFEITEQTREAVGRWLEKKVLHKGEPLFPSRVNRRKPMTTRQYARLLASWLHAIGLDPSAYGTHSLRRTKAAMIYRRTGNLRAVQLLLGHTKIESTVRYLGIDVDDALLIAEQVEI